MFKEEEVVLEARGVEHKEPRSRIWRKIGRRRRNRRSRRRKTVKCPGGEKIERWGEIAERWRGIKAGGRRFRETAHGKGLGLIRL